MRLTTFPSYSKRIEGREETDKLWEGKEREEELERRGRVLIDRRKRVVCKR